jgi:hypothetical protein
MPRNWFTAAAAAGKGTAVPMIAPESIVTAGPEALVSGIKKDESSV